MRVVAEVGSDDLAKVYIAQTSEGKSIEFVESLQPPLSREQKWVLIVSTLSGCPVACRFCDAGGWYDGKLSTGEIMAQIDYLVMKRFGNPAVPVRHFKIQFARVGEPSFNANVLEVLKQLPARYDARGLMPSISTIAPAGSEEFFDSLIPIKETLYPGRFQFQFSIHTTDTDLRSWIIPIRTWSLQQMAEYGKRFFKPGDRKITLNFALLQNAPIDADELLRHFHPEIFLIKLTPVNPTHRALQNRLRSLLPESDSRHIVDPLRTSGYEVIVSIGELEDNSIGSNCGQYVMMHRSVAVPLPSAYTYDVRHI
jgi:23S rRNA (adenine2503-C2)-methyltransferase